MNRWTFPTALAVVLGLVVAAPAAADDDVTFVDPGVDSPAGMQYEIPASSARRDAAPTPRRGSGGGSGGGSGRAAITGSAGYGTPTDAPGAASGGSTSDAGSAGGDRGRTGRDGADREDDRSERRRLSSAADGSGPAVGRTSDAGAAGVAMPATDDAAVRSGGIGPDVDRAVLLVLLALVIGGAFGIAFRGARRSAR
ncbi:MAG: hypothetical protein M0P31_10395 [Solirubrobacteraceae bacterium]|nr:hypothetical protein [Solirubrobacteraceae bacterium]